MSKVNPAPVMSIKFKMFPTPKYLKTKKATIPNAIIIPFLVLPKITAKVKKNERNTSRKKRIKTPPVWGSIKYMSENKSIHDKRVAISVGKKFLLLSFAFCLILPIT